MANKCSICTHKKRAEIEAALARGDSKRTIAHQYRTSQDALKRHSANHITAALREAEQNQVIATAVAAQLPAIERSNEITVCLKAELEQCFVRVNKLFTACEDWLIDPNNPERYTLDARAHEVEVIYEEFDDILGRPVKKKSTLEQLLARCEKELGVTVVQIERKIADPRKLLLDTAGRISGQIEILGKLTGAFQVDKENESDRAARLRRDEENRQWFRDYVRETMANLNKTEPDALDWIQRNTPDAMKWRN